MAYWIKANPKVVAYLHLETTRNQLKDGNYLLWQADLQPFGSLVRIFDICSEIGAIAMRANEAKQEQDGTVLRPLPVATDYRFIIDPKSAVSADAVPSEDEIPTSDGETSTDGAETPDTPIHGEDDAEGNADDEADPDESESVIIDIDGDNPDPTSNENEE